MEDYATTIKKRRKKSKVKYIQTLKNAQEIWESYEKEKNAQVNTSASLRNGVRSSDSIHSRFLLSIKFEGKSTR